jgi:hypothetical protein
MAKKDKEGFSFSLVGLRGLIDVTLTAIKTLPPWQKLFVYALFVVSLLSLIPLAFTLLKGEYFYSAIFSVIFSILFISSIITGLMAFLAYLKHSGPSGLSLTPGGAKAAISTGQAWPSWTRVVPKIPIKPPSKLSEFNTLLAEIRDAAVGKIRELRSDKDNLIDKQHVRVNVFLAGTDTVEEYGEVCGLFIPKRLHVGMEDESERGIVFRPNEGVTGRVFTLGKPFGAKAVPTGKGLDWIPVPLIDEGEDLDKQKFLLRESHVKLIHKQLRWIISFPLKAEVGGPEKTMGVLNVDGLEHPLDDPEMKELARYLTNRVDRLAAEIVKLPKVKITIVVEDVIDVGEAHPG